MKAAKIAENCKRLASFYAEHKPNLQHMTISAADAQALREDAKKDKEKKTNDVYLAGFDVTDTRIRWRGYDLVEPKLIPIVEQQTSI